MALFKRGRIWWMSFMFEGKQVRRSTEVEDRKLAEKVYHTVMAEVAANKWFDRMPGETITVRELLDRYLLDHSARNKAPGTHRRDKSLSDHLKAAFGDLTLTRLRPALLAAYKGERRAKGAAPKTVNDELTLLGHAYKLACREWEWVTDNPVLRVTKETVRNQIERWLTVDEEQRLFAASPEWLREILDFALNTGFRQSEILNLKWPQVDLFRRTITLLEQKNRSRDTLPVNETTLEVLKTQAKVRSMNGYVFCSQAGTQMSARNLLRAFYKARRTAKIEKFRFHDLRHTWATRLIQNGVDLYTVQKLGRWKTITMVMRYAHHYPESLRGGIQVLDRLRAGVSTNLAQSGVGATPVPAEVPERFGAPGRN